MRRRSDDTLLLLIEDDDAVQLSAVTTETLTPDEWNHIVMMQDGNGPKIYLNGVECTLTVTGADATAWADHLSINSITVGNGSWQLHADGTMDEVRFYTRALSEDEVTQHRNGTYLDNDGLAARWGFDVQTDSAWTTNTATQTEEGVTGGGVLFDGTNDYLNAGTSAAYVSSTGAIEFWYKPNEENHMDDLVNFYEDTYYNYLLIRRNANDTVVVRIEDNDAGVVSLTTTETLKVGQWNHIAVTQDGTGVSVYINGEEATTTGTDSSAYWTNHLSLLGTWFGRGHWGWSNGEMDEIRVYDAALSGAEVAQHYRGATTGAEDIVSRWGFDVVEEEFTANTTTYTADGLSNGAAVFDGTDDYFNAGADSRFSSSTGTIDLWFNADQGSREEDLVHIYESGTSDYLLIRKKSDGTIRVIIEDGDAAQVDITTTASITAGEWTHLVVMQDGTGVRIFLDGTEATVTGTNSSTYWTDHLSIAATLFGDSAWADHNFDGAMDRVQVYGRALVENEIMQHAEGVYNTLEDPFASWNFDFQTSIYS